MIIYYLSEQRSRMNAIKKRNQRQITISLNQNDQKEEGVKRFEIYSNTEKNKRDRYLVDKNFDDLKAEKLALEKEKK